MLEPYRRQLDRVADLDILVGYSPNGARRSAPQGGDSPLGNLVGTSIWLRLGVQTDFSLTNSTGIRTDLLPGPITIEQMYNIFPFDNSISKMQLSGTEVQELFDFVARRSANRGCTSQVQIAGAKVRLDCTGCQRPGSRPPCNSDEDCPSREPGSCNLDSKTCTLNACAEQVYIGHTEAACKTDADCPDDSGQPLPSGCDKVAGRCRSLIRPTNLYELATSNYLAGGGSGFRVLQRNTTQFDTKIQQRDALVDYMRQGKPCGYKADAGTAEGLKACATDGDCASEGDFVCACPSSASSTGDGAALACVSKEACDPGVGRCVLRACRTDVAKFNARRCVDSPDRPTCMEKLNPCVVGGESCKILACVDDKAGAATDARVEMIGR
ncbi:MAG: 5'-nucleotidase C-terminal domain-containing protein [Polyangiaceae bacterium]